MRDCHVLCIATDTAHVEKQLLCLGVRATKRSRARGQNDWAQRPHDRRLNARLLCRPRRLGLL